MSSVALTNIAASPKLTPELQAQVDLDNIMAGLAPLAIIPAVGLPNYRPGEIPSDETASEC
ncbi:hypothetical protein [Bradyrhizobium cenepequi]